MTISAQIGLERPQLLPISIFLVIYLLFSMIIEFSQFLISPDISPYTTFASRDVSVLLLYSPFQYAVIFVAGVVMLLTNTSMFVSRRKLSIAAYMLISASIVVPLSLYYTPLSLLITLSLESLGQPQATVTIYYHLIVSALISVLLLFPFLIIGKEIFLKGDNRIELTGFLFFLAYILIVPLIDLIHVLSQDVLKLGNSLASFILITLPVLLEFFAYILMAIPFVKHIGNLVAKKNLNSTPRP